MSFGFLKSDINFSGENIKLLAYVIGSARIPHNSTFFEFQVITFR